MGASPDFLSMLLCLTRPPQHRSLLVDLWSGENRERAETHKSAPGVGDSSGPDKAMLLCENEPNGLSLSVFPAPKRTRFPSA